MVECPLTKAVGVSLSYLASSILITRERIMIYCFLNGVVVFAPTASLFCQYDSCSEQLMQESKKIIFQVVLKYVAVFVPICI